MQIPRVRFTIRRMMAAVAVTASLMGVTVGLERRSERFRKLAEDHGGRATGARHVFRRERVVGPLGMSPQRPSTLSLGDFDPLAESLRRQRTLGALQEARAKVEANRRWQSAMQVKYARAAHYLWLPVASAPLSPNSASGGL
jgi:hypothetical protein